MTRSIRRAHLAAGLLCLGMTTAANAALNCPADARDQPVAHHLCSQPRLVELDRAMDRALADVSSPSDAAASALATDQANWQAETLSTAWALMDGGDTSSKAAASALATRYRQRLAYLKAMNQPADGPAAAVITSAK